MLNILKYTLKQLTKITIWRYKPDVIAITGSVGKTSAKEAIYAVLSASGKQVRKSGGNLNNELGVPLTILGNWPEAELKLVSRAQPAGEKKLRKLFFWLKVVVSAIIRVFNPCPPSLRSGAGRRARKSGYPQVLVLEYGADRPGDIKKLLEICQPKIGIITAIGEIPVHIEFYSGPEAVVREKSKLVEQMSVNDFAVLNFDDKTVMEIKERTRAKLITFGFKEGAEVKITSFENYFEEGLFVGVCFKIEHNGNIVPVKIQNTIGRSSAYAAGVATCIGLIYELNLVEICEALSSNYRPAKHRMNLISGIKDCWVIDDSYNASPISMKSALETIQDLKTNNRKIAILGDMLELGEYSSGAHKSIGKLVSGIVDFLITVGPNGKIISESAGLNGLEKDKILSFDNADEAVKAVRGIINKNDIILVKASRGIGLDKVVEEIKVNS
ncbi:MAG: UDP-N-acetylmuramoyl-tripeptide--D-alanyl-D-alanine ligase [Candidatus Paceibacterota bacterium]